MVVSAERVALVWGEDGATRLAGTEKGMQGLVESMGGQLPLY